jgi:PTH1 family peptidyl-tRNA hydrolase
VSDTFLIVGLGNPGSKYAETRHNAGFWFLDKLLQQYSGVLKLQTRLQAEIARIEINGHACVLAMPTTFMNHSGQAVRAVMDYFRISTDKLFVAYDELDIPPGVARLKAGGGHGGHNGIRDIFRHLPEHDFKRLRIGIGHPGIKDRVTDYVLGRPSAAEELVIRHAIKEAVDIMPAVLSGNWAGAMKSLHTSTQASSD